MSSFTAWLARQDHRHDPVGDLARDFTADPLRPADDHVATILDYVSTAGGTAAADACRSAVREWEASTK